MEVIRGVVRRVVRGVVRRVVRGVVRRVVRGVVCRVVRGAGSVGSPRIGGQSFLLSRNPMRVHKRFLRSAPLGNSKKW